MSQIVISIITGTCSALLAIIIPFGIRKINDTFRHKFLLLTTEKKEEAIRYIYSIIDISCTTPDEALSRYLKRQHYGLWADISLIKSLFDYVGIDDGKNLSKRYHRAMYILKQAAFCEKHQHIIKVKYKNIISAIILFLVIITTFIYYFTHIFIPSVAINEINIHLLSIVYLIATVVVLFYFYIIIASIISLIQIPLYLKSINYHSNKFRRPQISSVC